MRAEKGDFLVDANNMPIGTVACVNQAGVRATLVTGKRWFWAATQALLVTPSLRKELPQLRGGLKLVKKHKP